jgi:predicted ATP-grasp superfamily ATP-dependent carboligase
MSEVLLTYGWVRSSYAALRNLSAHGVKVCVSDSHRVGMCQLSRLKDGFERYTSHYENEVKFVDDIIRICKARDVQMILTSHNETEILARHRDRLPENLAALLPDTSHCELFNNKASAYEYAKLIGVPVPLRINYDNPKQISAAIHDAGLNKTVIKLLTGNSAKGVFYAENPLEAQRIVGNLICQYNLDYDRYPLIEEQVSGDGWGYSVLYWHGQQVANFTHRRLREKISTGGTSTLREVARHPELEAAAKNIFDKVGWHGLAMSEFKVCPKTGKFWFIEVNPRMWGSIPLAISAGVEFPYLAYLCASRGLSSAKDYQVGCKVHKNWRGRWMLGDAMLATQQFFSGNFLAASKNLFGSGADSLDDFYWDDPFAFLGEVLYYGANSFAKMSLNPSEKGMLG